MSATKNCHVMAKPSGSVCNLDCSYCFYLEKEKLYPERQKEWKMDEKTLRAYIQQTITAQHNDYVQFTWQGGEPTLLGLAYFEKIVALCEEYNTGKHIAHSFQTNGLLLTDEWCQFFKKHNFLIGLSIDGPAELHDNYRLTRSGKGTHNKVMQGVELLKKHLVEFNTLTVVNNVNVKYPERIYQFLKGIGSTHIQFIPLIEREAASSCHDQLRLVLPDESLAKVTPWSVPSLQYGEFLCKIFDRWVREDVGTIFINMFDSTLGAWCGEPTNICHFVERCGHNFVLEANGDLYNCDHFVYPEHLLGNIHHQTINEMNQSEQAIQFGQEKATKLSQGCQNCKFKFACNGGCPKHRFAVSSRGLPEHNYFCQGYKLFFQHSAKHMLTMKKLLERGFAPSDVMHMNRQQTMHNIGQINKIGRNDPCPCGSQNKYKRCCG